MVDHEDTAAEEGRLPATVQSGSEDHEKTTEALDRDPFLVTWKDEDDPEDPKNWTKRQKWAATLAVASFTFISPVSSSIIAPATEKISASLGITNSSVGQISYSIFVLGYAFGPFFLSPLSEIYGRSRVLQIANLFYLIFNTAAGFSRNTAELIAFRFLSGLGGSAPLAVGGGVLGDLWRTEERAAALSIYSLGPLVGPAVGPITGAWIAQYTTWRWALWAPSIVDVFIQLAALKYLRETFAPTLLRRKAAQLRKDTGNPHYQTAGERADLDITVVLKRGFSRPFVLLGTQPIVQCLGLYMAYLYGLYYLVLGDYSNLWVQRYQETRGISGLNYISLGLGPILGAQISALVNDRIYCRLKRRNNGTERPEYRLPLMFVGSVIVPIGLLWYGWSAQAHTHWIVPNIDILIYSCGGILGFQCIQTYLIDVYTTYAASALAAVAFGRCILAFILPLIVRQLYDTLDYGWGTSLLAFIAIGLGLPFPILLWKYGAVLRARSPYATGDSQSTV